MEIWRPSRDEGARRSYVTTGRCNAPATREIGYVRGAMVELESKRGELVGHIVESCAVFGSSRLIALRRHRPPSKGQ